MKKESIIFIACITVFLAQLGITMYLPALPALAKAFSSPPQDVALALSAFLVGMAAPMLAWGGLGQRYGRKAILSISLLLYAACSAAIPMTHQVEAFILLRFLQGMGASGMSVMSRVMIKDHFSGAQLAKSLSWLSISFVISLGVGQFLGSLLLASLGWQAIFFSLAIATLALLLVLAGLPSPASQPAGDSQSGIKAYATLLRSRDFLLPALAGGLGYAVIITFNACAPFIFQDALHWSASEYGLLGWPISLSYFAGAWLVNRYVVRKGRHFFILLGLSVLLAGCALMLLGGVLRLSLLLWLPYCLAVIGQAMNYPVSLAIATENSPVAGPYAMALCGFMHQLMAAAIGAVASTLPGQPIWPSAGLMCMLALAAFAAFARSRQPSLSPA
ncbi:MFS transporter [Chromobacterium alticapitis]|uniref:MFS transporter n=1 Tax=Chromobacterium alticapitis TaxID=2073169 RepID=A0A2S5DGY9_9NEIS|nr:MFS transporter [Chromobacterium alticapitis]POZ62356.1 MFS transporter [Chromobacterium alticapitis]